MRGFSLSFLNYPKMPSTIYKKAKERIALILRIKKLNKEAEPCSCCRLNSRRYLVDPKESPRYLEYIYSKKACDLSSPKLVYLVIKRVCRFFISLIRRKVPLVESPSS